MVRMRKEDRRRKEDLQVMLHPHLLMCMHLIHQLPNILIPRMTTLTRGFKKRMTNEEKQNLLCQLQAQEEALENLQHNSCEVKINSSTPCIFLDKDFIAFKEHTTCIDSKLLNRMGYEGKGLDINDHGIINLIKVAELHQHTGLGYVRKEIVECANIASKPSMIDDENPSPILSKSTVEVKDVELSSVSSSHNIISVGNLEMPITRTSMRLIIKMRYKGEGLGIHWKLRKSLDLQVWGTLKDSAQKCQKLPRHC